MKMVRRQFLHFAGAATAFFAPPYVVRAQAQPPRNGAPPTRSAQDRLEEALARIADPNGEGSRACLTVYAQAARAAADAADARARIGTNLGPLDGAIVTIKDLFDVAGEPTRAGSKVLADAPPATTDAPALRRLHAGGAVIVAKTNMAEFAFSGIGANPHYGTPGNPADHMRVPGGSSSGAAVAVADGMCEIAIGSDTGGSTRVPAALAAWSDTSRPSLGCRPKARFRCPTRSIRSGRSRGASRRAPPRMRSWPATIPGHWNLSRYRACGSAFPRDSRSAASIRRSRHNFPTRPRSSAEPACACPTRCFRFLTTWYASIPRRRSRWPSPGRSIANGSRRVQPTTILRNPAIANFFDLCAISLPLPRAGGLPVGLMLVARNGHDRRLFRMAAAVERLFAG